MAKENQGNTGKDHNAIRRAAKARQQTLAKATASAKKQDTTSRPFSFMGGKRKTEQQVKHAEQRESYRKRLHAKIDEYADKLQKQGAVFFPRAVEDFDFHRDALVEAVKLLKRESFKFWCEEDESGVRAARIK